MREAVSRAQREVRRALDSGEHLLASLGMCDVEVDGVDLAIEMPVTPRLANSRGSLQGGLIATLIDVVAGRVAIAGAAAGARRPRPT